jgi:hypothetical protein
MILPIAETSELLDAVRTAMRLPWWRRGGSASASQPQLRREQAHCQGAVAPPNPGVHHEARSARTEGHATAERGLDRKCFLLFERWS